MIGVQFSLTLCMVLAANGPATTGDMQPAGCVACQSPIPAPPPAECYWPYCRIMPVIFTAAYKEKHKHDAKGSETLPPGTSSKSNSKKPSTATNEPGVKPPLASPLPSRKVDLNSALVEEIQALPGMSPGMAAHILAGRPYANFEDLLRNGVPQNVIDQIRPYVILSH